MKIPTQTDADIHLWIYTKSKNLVLCLFEVRDEQNYLPVSLHSGQIILPKSLVNGSYPIWNES